MAVDPADNDLLPIITLNGNTIIAIINSGSIVTMFIIAGVPLSPGKPTVQLSSRSRPQDENSVTDEINISWSIPKDDGGFPITGYRIEMLDIQSSNWIEITFIEGFEPRCTLSNILYGIMYRLIHKMSSVSA